MPFTNKRFKVDDKGSEYKINIKKNYINKAIETLNDRERIIIRERKFREKSITLDELGQKLKISKGK